MELANRGERGLARRNQANQILAGVAAGAINVQNALEMGRELYADARNAVGLIREFRQQVDDISRVVTNVGERAVETFGNVRETGGRVADRITEELQRVYADGEENRIQQQQPQTPQRGPVREPNMNPDINPRASQVARTSNQFAMQNTEPITEAATAPGSTSTYPGQNNITPIDHIQPSFPWKNTVNALLQHNASFSCNDLVPTSDPYNVAKIRMNTYYLPYADHVAYVPNASDNLPARGIDQANVGRYLTKAISTGNATVLHHGNIDDHMDACTLASTQPARFSLYEANYSAYTVVACHWEINIRYPYSLLPSSDGSRANINLERQIDQNTPYGSPKNLVAAQYIVSGDDLTSTFIPLDAESDVMTHRFQPFYEKFITVEPHQQRTIKGTWRPGMLKHNPRNDKDIDTWTAVGTAPTQSHREHLVVQFKEHPEAIYSDSATCMNYTVKLTYEVQFKELVSNVLYPYEDASSSTVNTYPAALLSLDPTI